MSCNSGERGVSILFNPTALLLYPGNTSLTMTHFYANSRKPDNGHYSLSHLITPPANCNSRSLYSFILEILISLSRHGCSSVATCRGRCYDSWWQHHDTIREMWPKACDQSLPPQSSNVWLMFSECKRKGHWMMLGLICDNINTASFLIEWIW